MHSVLPVDFFPSAAPVEWTSIAHRGLFETFPGFTWINATAVILGAVYAFAFAWIFAWYFVWMHNSSLEGHN
jgi:hypothetical protein